MIGTNERPRRHDDIAATVQETFMNKSMTSKEENGRVRMPAVAGLFYPDNSVECFDAVEHLLRDALAPETPCPKALIVPHAGYIYSGPIAAIAYKKLIQHQRHFSHVVLLGPSHKVAFCGMAVPESHCFRTPLGDIPLDIAELENIKQLGGVVVSQDAHRWEHSLEVQLPFLQRVLDQFTLVPIVVGDATADAVAAVIDYFWRQPQTLIVISSDLSHYLDYDQAREIDRDTVELIEQLQPTLAGEQACGCNAVNGLLRYAAEVEAQVECVDLRNSGDTAGDRTRVVGYGAFVIY